MIEAGRFRGSLVGVFFGGESSERDVSLRTGAAAAAALRRKGYDVVEIDIKGDWLGRIRDAEIGVAPQLRVVRLKHHPLRLLIDCFLNHRDQAPHVDVAPIGITAKCARTQPAQPSPSQRP